MHSSQSSPNDDRAEGALDKQELLSAPEKQLDPADVASRVNAATESASEERARFILEDVQRQIREREEKKKQFSEPQQQIKIPKAGDVPDFLSKISGAKRTAGPKMILKFTCDYKGECEQDKNVEKSRKVTKVISRNSYENGVVLVRCPCEKLHLIADNLKFFGDERNIEEIMANTENAVVHRQMMDDDLLHLDD
jgi:hypothetical protein